MSRSIPRPGTGMLRLSARERAKQQSNVTVAGDILSLSGHFQI
jgi:hypothetical protein